MSHDKSWRDQLSAVLQGHFQIFFHPEMCQLSQFKLSTAMKIMYTSGIWSYMICSICTPFYMVGTLNSQHLDQPGHAHQP